MAKKTYVLTVEFDEKEDTIEYIQEEIIEPSEVERSVVINELIEQDYWNDDSLDIIRKFYSGEIGES